MDPFQILNHMLSSEPSCRIQESRLAKGKTAVSSIWNIDHLELAIDLYRRAAFSKIHCSW